MSLFLEQAHGKEVHQTKPLFRDRPEYKSIGYARQTSNKQSSIGA